MIYGKGYYSGTVSVDRESHCYRQWKELMRRCYSPSYQKRYPSTITVCEEWHCYDDFYNWYHKKGFTEGTITCKVVSPYCKHHSPDNSYILPLKWVRVLAGRGNDKGYSCKDGKFQVKVRDGVHDYPVHIGYFETEIEAHHTFIDYKIDLLKTLIKEYDNDPYFQDKVDCHIAILRGSIT